MLLCPWQLIDLEVSNLEYPIFVGVFDMQAQRKNQNKYSKFKIRRVQIDELLRTLAKKSKLSLSEG